MNNSLNLIEPNWPKPPNVKAFTTTRRSGFSEGQYNSLNLALHVGDAVELVAQNRQQLNACGLPSEPTWLEQTHSTIIADISQQKVDSISACDGSYSRCANRVCAILTADCLPILLSAKDGSCVAAIHAGWRGLAAGIVECAAAQFIAHRPFQAWIGPAISQAFFEVGYEVKDAFCADNAFLESAFKPNGEKFMCDLSEIASIKLSRLGVECYQSNICTFLNKDDFYSYRRDGITGRMASVIWIEE